MAKPIKPSATWVDRAIGWVSPGAGLKRAHARAALVRAYEGASRRDGWAPKRPGASATADHLADARELRVRARALLQNVPNIASAVRVMVCCTIGAGIKPSWINDPDKTVATRWNAWVKVADYDCLLDFYGLQAKAWQAVKVDGEVLVRLRTRRTGPTTVPLQLQLLEADWLDTQRNEVRGGNEIIGGIEYNTKGERVQYWLFDRHPGDVGLRVAQRESQPIPASEILHLFNPTRPGQQSGISELAPVIATVRDQRVYEDSEQARKNLESRMGVMGEWDESLLTGVELPASPAGGDATPGMLDLGEIAGGSFMGMPPGMRNPTFIQPAAAPGYVDYIKQIDKRIAAGTGVPYEFMTGDLSEVNFSSSRVRTNLYKQQVEREQWTLFVPMFCDRIAQRWLSLLDLSGARAPQGVYADWTTPKWASVNPVQDVAADLAEIKGGLCSISEKIRQRGYEPELVFQEMKQDLQRLQSDGTLPLLAALWGAQSPLELVAGIGQEEGKK
jgi:lambda family phage portal protein